MSGATIGTATVDNLTEPLKSDALGLVAASSGRVWIVSGWRSRAQQQTLYDEYVAGTGNLAAKPGTSEHEAGRAVDFGGDLGLAAQLARRFHLEQTVTGEAWHYEEVGNRSGAIPAAGHLAVGAGTGLPNPFDAASSIGDAFAKLTDPHLWLRVAIVAGGLLLTLLGMVLLGLDVHHLSPTATPPAAQITAAAGTGKPVV